MTRGSIKRFKIGIVGRRVRTVKRGLKIPLIFLFFGIRLELVFFCSAFWANPVLRQVLEHRGRLNAVIGIAEFRVIYVTADGALPLAHLNLLIDF
jgi:hypothetical protein